MPSRYFLTFIFCALLLGGPALVSAAAAADRIEVKAERTQTKKLGDQVWENRFFVAQLKHRDAVLTADELLVNTAKEDTTITSASKPQLRDPIATITGDAVVMKTRATTARFTGNAKILLAARPVDGKAAPTQLIFTADTIEYNYDTKQVRCTGHVTLTVLNAVITFGDQPIEYDVKEGQLRLPAPADRQGQVGKVVSRRHLC